MTAVDGCDGCATTAGAMGCPIHGTVGGFPITVLPRTVTTRSVPVACGVCHGGGVRAQGPPEDEETEWVRCSPCNGQGWLYVVETTRVGS